MRFTPVDDIPKSRTSKKVLDAYFKTFMNMDVKIVKVDFTDGQYASVFVAQRCLQRSINLRGYPIDVRTSDGEIYFVRRDM